MSLAQQMAHAALSVLWMVTLAAALGIAVPALFRAWEEL